MIRRASRNLTIPFAVSVAWIAAVHPALPSEEPVPPGMEALTPGEAADDLAKRTYEVVASGAHAFAATTAGLTVYDISDPAAPRLVTSMHFPGSANGLALAGNRVLLALGPAGLRAIDVSDPSVPRLVGAIDTDGSVNAVAPVRIGPDGEGLAVIADGALGVRSIAVGREGLRIVSSIDTGRHAVHVAVRGTLVASADEDDGVGLYRISDDGLLREVARVPAPGTARGVVFSNDRLFVAAGPVGVVALGVDDPARPKILGSHPTGHYARGIAAARGNLFVADSQSGLWILEEGKGARQRPAHRRLAVFETGGSANRVSLAGSMAIVAIDAYGIRIVDVTDPESPRGF